MSNEVQANVDASNTTRLQSNASLSEFARFREQQLMGNQEVVQEVQEEVQEQPQEETEVVDAAEETQEVSEAQEENQEQAEVSEETEADVLSNIDLDNLSEDELRELSEKLGSRAVMRFGELTAKRKQAEAELSELRQKLQDSDNPLKSSVDPSTNPYRNVESIEKLQKISQDVDNIVEWAEDLIFNSEGYGADDVITEISGKEYTKAQVRKQLMDARKAEKKYLPAQLKVLQGIEYSKQAKANLIDKAKQEFGWIGKEESEVNKKYEAMLKDSRLEGLEQFSPELAAQMPYLLAHSANSLYGRRVIPSETAPKTTTNVKLDPPSSAPGAATSDKKIGKSLQALQEQKKAFRETGTKDDFIKMRTMRFSQ